MPLLDHRFPNPIFLFLWQDGIKISGNIFPIQNLVVKKMVLKDLHRMEHWAVMRDDGEQLGFILADISIPEDIHQIMKQDACPESGARLNLGKGSVVDVGSVTFNPCRIADIGKAVPNNEI